VSGAYTRIEMMVVAMARQVQDDHFWAQGLATPMTAAALMLARRTHAKRALAGYVIGNSVSDVTGPLSITHYEGVTLTGCLRRWGFGEAVREMLPWANPFEFFRPAQVDPTGATNNVCIGPYDRPKVRLPGAGGIPDVTPISRTAYLYVPRHTPQVFVPQLDFKSGVGHVHPEEKAQAGITGTGPVRLISELGIFHWPKLSMEILSLHPGVNPQEVVDKTGFPVRIPDTVEFTAVPTERELECLRKEVDPLGLRDLEALGTKERQQLLREILEREAT
jgi:glutaconate CoA-transferase subunit B